MLLYRPSKVRGLTDSQGQRAATAHLPARQANKSERRARARAAWPISDNSRAAALIAPAANPPGLRTSPPPQ
eukprot:10945407-Alexandrium_andersonii.AAC.1